ncbi:hypothetical protein PLESTB_001660700 [Pleodorina starrii]|uniref:Uncharacterized protein n=1 Tax=Pleodorina starrii TaxID=330485 RepID=A0A9W6BZ04_9CHLO|nr:hypothetical protein PLESTM_001924200 [Pleodorina starrii]GLC60708.1 hypothetical protein PLESTB_001660700 [Pleodorina starrii]GLC70315.1 hypothetical protein PLESTF_000958400 [Pleodorina starrii]
MGPELGLNRPGLRVLELGAGLGWLGMTVARNLPAAAVVVLTEQEEGGGLAWLRHNLALNAHLPGMGVVRAEPCDWRSVAGRIEQQQQQHGQVQVQPCSHQGQKEGRCSGPAAPQQSIADMPRDSQVWVAGTRDADPSLSESPPLQLQLQTQGPQSCPTPLAVDPLPEYGTCRSGSGPIGPRLQPDPSADLEPALGGADLCPLRDVHGLGRGCSDDTGTVISSSGERSGSSSSSSGTDSGCTLCSQQWDLVLGSDLVYNDVGADCLPRVMRALAGSGSGRILYCHTKHRFDTHDMQFFSQLAACGLECREVHEPSVPSPPPSPPPLTELFPDMRIAVYDIRLAG